MKLNLLLIFLWISCIVYAQTIITGGNVSGVWTRAGNPYLIQGDITIPDQQSLVIMQGTHVLFEDNYTIYVNGSLKAIGTPSDSVYFEAEDLVNGWHGMRFENVAAYNDTSRIAYCSLTYGKALGLDNMANGGGIYIKDCYASLIIEYNRIALCFAGNHHSGGGICCAQNASPIIRHNTIENCTAGWGGGIYAKTESNPIIEDNIIRNNYAYHGSGAIHISTSVGNTQILNNTIYGNGSDGNGGAIGVIGANAVIVNNMIQNNKGVSKGGIHCTSSSGDKYVQIIGNLITNNLAADTTGTFAEGSGISVHGMTWTIVNNTVCNNVANDPLSGPSGVYADTSPNMMVNKMVNNVIWGNVMADGSLCYEAHVEATNSYANLVNNSMHEGVNGVYYTSGTVSLINQYAIDPAFVYPCPTTGNVDDFPRYDWTYEPESGLINSGAQYSEEYGLPETDLWGNPRINGGRIDIGAFEYNPNTPIVSDNVITPSPTIHIYPNPARNECRFVLSHTDKAIRGLEVFNLKGQKVWSQPVTNALAEDYEWDTSKLPTGVYFYRFISEKASPSGKLTIIH